MAVYEVVLRFHDRDEVRLTDRPLDVGTSLNIGGAEWLVESQEAQRGAAAMRYVCVKLRERSRELRARSATLIEGLEQLRELRGGSRS
jgi:hypothetical protein